MADEAHNDVEARLHAALDNMPGALVYTDDALAIVVCNQLPVLLNPDRLSLVVGTTSSRPTCTLSSLTDEANPRTHT